MIKLTLACHNATLLVHKQETTRAFSNPRDPAPLIPNPLFAHAATFNGGDVTDVDVLIFIDRLSNYFSLNSILPVAVRISSLWSPQMVTS